MKQTINQTTTTNKQTTNCFLSSRSQDLTKIEVDKLTPITQEIISRQATMNVRGLRVCGTMTCARVYHGLDAWLHCNMFKRMFHHEHRPHWGATGTYCRRAEPQVRFKQIAEVPLCVASLLICGADLALFRLGIAGDILVGHCSCLDSDVETRRSRMTASETGKETCTTPTTLRRIET